MNTKLIIGCATGVSTLGTLGGVGYWYSLPHNLKDELISENEKLLDVYGKNNDKEWKELAEKYKEDGNTITIDTNTTINKISDLTIPKPISGQEVDFSKLKDHCKKLFEKPIKKDADYEKTKTDAKNWCSLGSVLLKKQEPSVKKTSLKEAMNGSEFEALDTDGERDNETWKKLIEKYNSTGLPSDVTKITVTGNIQNNPSDNHIANIGIFKKACKALLEKTENYEEDKKTVTNWCNKKSKLISTSMPEGQHN